MATFEAGSYAVVVGGPFGALERVRVDRVTPGGTAVLEDGRKFTKAGRRVGGGVGESLKRIEGDIARRLAHQEMAREAADLVSALDVPGQRHNLECLADSALAELLPLLRRALKIIREEE